MNYSVFYNGDSSLPGLNPEFPAPHTHTQTYTFTANRLRIPPFSSCAHSGLNVTRVFCRTFMCQIILFEGLIYFLTHMRHNQETQGLYGKRASKYFGKRDIDFQSETKINKLFLWISFLESFVYACSECQLVRTSRPLCLLFWSGRLLFGMNEFPTLSILAKATSWMEQLRER